MLALNPGVFRRDCFKLLLPDLVRGDRVRLVAHRYPRLAVTLCPLERGADDALDPLPRVHFFRDMLIAAVSAATEVLALGVLTKNHEIDGRNGR